MRTDKASHLYQDPQITMLIDCLIKIHGTPSPVMHEISVPLVPPQSWSVHQNKFWVPGKVNTVCPHCNEASSLDLEHKGIQSIGRMNIVPASGRCIGCNQISSVWIIEPRSNNTSKGCQSIWMLPIPKSTVRKPIDLLEGSASKRIQKTYRGAIDCFNAKIWTACINECGRVIEGISEDKFPTKEDKQKIKSLLQNNQDSVEKTLFSPILSLTSAVRLSRRTGSHFNFTEDPDEDLADKVLTLTEYALEYFYGLHQRVSAIRGRVDDLTFENTSPD